MTKYFIACAIIFAFLIFLKFVQDSPVRTWTTALLTAAVLSVLVCFYLNWAFPKPTPPATRAQKVIRYAAELRRDFSRIKGVDRADIQGSTVRINFAEDKSLAELKQTARHTGGAAAYFMKNGDKFQITVILSVHGEDRYQMLYDPDRGMVEETTF
jgi:hypothetical protein